MHRVYGADASMDPTKIETIVIQECAERKARHEARNQERKLTSQQKKEKKKQKFLADRANELIVCVFKVSAIVSSSHFQVLHLSGKNRFKVDKNAQQLYLTGCCIITPHFTLVVVEGGSKSLRRYKKLMMRRIRWNEELQEDEDRDEEIKSEEEEKKEGQEEKEIEKKDESFLIANNRCDMIWEVRARLDRH